MYVIRHSSDFIHMPRHFSCYSAYILKYARQIFIFHNTRFPFDMKDDVNIYVGIRVSHTIYRAYSFYH